MIRQMIITQEKVFLKYKYHLTPFITLSTLWRGVTSEARRGEVIEINQLFCYHSFGG